MIRSLRRHDFGAIVWVLCLSDQCMAALRALGEPDLRLIALSDFEAAYPVLAATKADRSLIEYYFTLTPSVVSHVLDQVQADETVTYVDGDLYFFASPAPLHEMLEGQAVTIIPHRFVAAQRHLERFGIYNVGWLGFRNDSRGRAVAHWWRDRCIEWCHDRLEGDRYADQKYLDRFQQLFEGVVPVDHPGANLAPWNVDRHVLTLENGRLLADGEPVIFFHYQGLRELGEHLYFTCHHQYRASLTRLMRRHIYRPYLLELSAIRKEVAPLIDAEIEPPLWRGAAAGGLTAAIKAKLQRPKRYATLLLRGQTLIVFDQAAGAASKSGSGS